MNEFGVTFFDVTTLKIYIGTFKDDDTMSSFRTLICQIRPVEVIFERELSNSDAVKMLKNSPIVPVFNPMPPKHCWSFIKTTMEITSLFGEENKWP
mmetsp:Transcript_23225/g.31656  ORF Transcript_23225/g.31656 Transcript_23225/m.31656 type:complete len:96 (-) Transcript_23225:242-529(-)